MGRRGYRCGKKHRATLDREAAFDAKRLESFQQELAALFGDADISVSTPASHSKPSMFKRQQQATPLSAPKSRRQTALPLTGPTGTLGAPAITGSTAITGLTATLGSPALTGLTAKPASFATPGSPATLGTTSHSLQSTSESTGLSKLHECKQSVISYLPWKLIPITVIPPIPAA